jgi:hypothetical protein
MFVNNDPVKNLRCVKVYYKFITLQKDTVKVNSAQEWAMKSQTGSRALFFLELRRQMGTGGQRHAPAGLPRGRLPVPILEENGWAPGPVWMGGENLCPTGIRSPDRVARSESRHRLS